MIKAFTVTNAETGKLIHKVSLPDNCSFEHQMVAFLDATRIVLTHASQGRTMILTVQGENQGVQ